VAAVPSGPWIPPPLYKLKKIKLPKSGKDPKHPADLSMISILSTEGQLPEKLVLQVAQGRVPGKRNFLNARRFGCLARHTTTLK
jgi:hypothetical protein